MDTEIYLKLEGVKGEAAATSYKEQIVLESWGWGMSNTGNLHASGSGAAGGGKPTVNNIEASKFLDASSPLLMQALCYRKHFPSATITMVANDVAFCTINLSKVLVVGVDLHNHMGPRMSETVNLHFGEYEVSYQPLDEKGAKKGGAISSGKYNIAAPAKA
jgi:type VI secretion system secreted protein Hcp